MYNFDLSPLNTIEYLIYPLIRVKIKIIYPFPKTNLKLSTVFPKESEDKIDS